MDDFTPPPPRPPPAQHVPGHRRAHSDVPPPLPPPPTDLPAGYRASTVISRPSTATDTMPGRRGHFRVASREGRRASLDPSTPGEDREGRQRQSSFSFLSRNKSRSREVPVVTAPDGHTMLRKQKLREQEERLRQQREARNARPPPVLPSPSPLPTLNTFGGDERPDSIAIISNKASNFSRPNPTNGMPTTTTTTTTTTSKSYVQQPVSPSMRGTTVNGKGEYLDPSSRMDSMNSLRHQSLASTTGNSYQSPRRMRRRKDPTPFNILVTGAKSSGKTSLIDFFKSSLALPPEKRHHSMTTPSMTTGDGAFTSHYIECEFDGERVGVTLWDSQGVEKNLVDLQVREMVTFIESKFEDTFTEESKVNRAPGAKDSHIHCVFLVLDPVRLDENLRSAKQQANGNAFAQARGPAGLADDLDMQIMKGLFGKTTVIPIISKADTLTGSHMDYLKRAVWNSVQAEKLDPLDALGLEEGDEDEDEMQSDASSVSDHDNFPIQTTSSSSVPRGHRLEGKHSRLDDSDASSDNPDSSFHAKSRSTNTTPSPGQPFKRPNSRGGTRSLTPHGASSSTAEVPMEEIYLPFTLLSPDPYELNAIGRRFPWGLADPFNPDHCDFVRLRDSVFSEWRVELRAASRERWYESWREQRLAQGRARIRQVGDVTPTPVVPSFGGLGAGSATGIRPGQSRPTMSAGAH